VLIDYASYAEKHNISYSATTRHEITVEDIEAVAKKQVVQFKPADILIIRSGWNKWYNRANREERVTGARDGHVHVGMQRSRESVEWLWNHHFAAVAGDAIAFEA
jgi:kynurenine formamidase